MNISRQIKNEVKSQLWSEADLLGWSNLSASEKAKHYSHWTESVAIGGRLGALMDPRKVRVYIKDTLLKPYNRERSAGATQILDVLGVSGNVDCVATYVKPHGLRLADGRLIAWSKGSEWKSTLLALFERAHENRRYSPYAAVFLQSSVENGGSGLKRIADDAADRLGIEKLIWIV